MTYKDWIFLVDYLCVCERERARPRITVLPSVVPPVMSMLTENVFQGGPLQNEYYDNSKLSKSVTICLVLFSRMCLLFWLTRKITFFSQIYAFLNTFLIIWYISIQCFLVMPLFKLSLTCVPFHSSSFPLIDPFVLIHGYFSQIIKLANMNRFK